ncbi:fused response regulator/phosphatase [Thiorhodococcus mannitoliphagus]|uniref:Fused response regulator/phosphatase n=1 Tax=Thiorhodococcus mannitoliphagus TaxID=329406 RepID=A0A6P1DVC3_9GAMM|nr:fused response regulator/phosphatase [Thiorhodococcus mannitoliphagus]NEX20636.1 fused response regulator/phosphatase [Thiorhodococcus mannitoliphagus]
MQFSTMHIGPPLDADPTASSEPETGWRGKALAVDDDLANLRLLRRMLERMGFAVVTATNGVEALEQFAARRPDLAVLDAVLPGMDGIEVGRRIKSMSAAEFVPIIFLTALADAASIMGCIRAGGDDFLTKPLSFKLLQARVIITERFRDLQRAMSASSEPLHELLEREHEEQRLAERVFSRAINSRNVETQAINSMRRSATTFNGDLLLTQSLPDGGLRILMADITGHGLGATIGALPVAEAFHAMAIKGVDDLQVLEEINRKLYATLPADRFMAAFMVSIAGNGRRLTWWNGGMPSGWLRSRHGLKELASHALPLGVLTELPPSDAPRALSVQDDDGLLLLSDGVLEAVDSKGATFGDGRLRQHLEAWSHGERLFGSLLAAWERHREGSALEDDVALLELVIGPALLDSTELEIGQARPGGWRWSVELGSEQAERLFPLKAVLGPLGLLDGLEAQSQVLEEILRQLYLSYVAPGRGLQSDPSLAAGAIAPDPLNILIRFEPLPSGGCFIIQAHWRGVGDSWSSGHSASPSDSEALGQVLGSLEQLCRSVRYDAGKGMIEAHYCW